MVDKPALDERQRRARLLVIGYPCAIVMIATLLNLFVFGVTPYIPSLPSLAPAQSLIVAALLLTLNHSWLMTATELTRVRFRMYATPEEWAKSGTRMEDIPKTGFVELERAHNAHRNTTENAIYFGLLATAFIFADPEKWSAIVWIIGFALTRLGYTYSYLRGNDDLRSLFMTLSLLSMYGIASHLLISLILAV